jgi:hypothetical protein
MWQYVLIYIYKYIEALEINLRQSPPISSLSCYTSLCSPAVTWPPVPDVCIGSEQHDKWQALWADWHGPGRPAVECNCRQEWEVHHPWNSCLWPQYNWYLALTSTEVHCWIVFRTHVTVRQFSRIHLNIIIPCEVCFTAMLSSPGPLVPLMQTEA